MLKSQFRKLLALLPRTNSEPQSLQSAANQATSDTQLLATSSAPLPGAADERLRRGSADERRLLGVSPLRSSRRNGSAPGNGPTKQPAAAASAPGSAPAAATASGAAEQQLTSNGSSRAAPEATDLGGGSRPPSASSGGTSRRTSRLGMDSGRGSRRVSLQDSPHAVPPLPPVPTAAFEPSSSSQAPQPQQPPRLAELPLHLLQSRSSADSPPAAPPQLPPLLGAAAGGAEPFWAGSGWSFGCTSDQNQRRAMEDRLTCEDLTGSPAFAGRARAGFFAVYDGHGGPEAAQYLQDHLLARVTQAGRQRLADEPLAVLREAVQRLEAEIVAKFLPRAINAGSTLLALLLVDNTLHIANVGDSRAVLGRGPEATQLTRDHKPACSTEAARIEADDPGADISCDGYMYGELAVARAIGSAHLKRDPSKRALIPTPDLSSVVLSAEDDFVLLATDGLWDRVDNGEAVAVARRSLAASRDAEAAARALVERAQRRSSSDNISVIALLLHGRPIAMPKNNSMLFRRQALNSLQDSPRSVTPAGTPSVSGFTTPRASTPASQPSSSSAAPTPPHGTALAAALQMQAAAAAAAVIAAARQE